MRAYPVLILQSVRADSVLLVLRVLAGAPRTRCAASEGGGMEGALAKPPADGRF